ncbi:hypothetical protein CK203_087034 [Vitis vinifera]|uniref:Uncharacterized protein n=1 Tax=Vitis vinifera TaxID=29760 RepID=A0A438CLS5_VITVI|nr:hypothetical protein CK203_087034 [Vitis vinifera]
MCTWLSQNGQLALFYSAAPRLRSRNLFTTSVERCRIRNKVFKGRTNGIGPSNAAQKLRPYFQAYPVVVLTDQPFRNILHKLSMKGQVMANFGWNTPEGLSSAKNQVKKNDGLCGLMEPPVIRIRSRAPAPIPNRRTFGASHPNGVSLPLTMKRSIRPSYLDWTLPWLYPSPGFGSTAIPNS